MSQLDAFLHSDPILQSDEVLQGSYEKYEHHLYVCGCSYKISLTHESDDITGVKLLFPTHIHIIPWHMMLLSKGWAGRYAKALNLMSTWNICADGTCLT